MLGVWDTDVHKQKKSPLFIIIDSNVSQHSLSSFKVCTALVSFKCVAQMI